MLGQTERLTERGEDESGEDVKEEDDRDGLRDLLVVGLDDRRGGCDGRTAADGRAYTDQCGDVAGDVQDTAQDKGDNERNRDGGDDNGQGLGADVGDIGQVQSESEQDDRVLQDFFGGKADTVGRTPLIMPEQRDDHAEQDGKDRAADDREGLTGQPAGNREEQAERQTG